MVYLEDKVMFLLSKLPVANVSIEFIYFLQSIFDYIHPFTPVTHNPITKRTDQTVVKLLLKF